MGFFQNLKDDLTSTIDDIAIKEEQGAAPSDTQSLLDLLKSEEFVEAINADEKEDEDSDEIKNVSDNSASEIEKQADAMLLGLEEVAAEAEVEETVEEVSEATEEVVEELAEVVEETTEAIDESVDESEEVAEETTAEITEEVTEEVLEDDGDSIDVLAEASLDDTLEDIMESAEEVTKESSVRDALNSLRNASLRYEQQLKNQDVDGMFLFANEEADEEAIDEADKEAIEEAEEDNELKVITEEVEEV